MRKFMVSVRFTKRPDREIVELMPAEHDFLAGLMKNGRLESVNVKKDWSGAWYAMYAPSRQEVDYTLQASPIIQYMEYDVEELVAPEGEPEDPAIQN